MIALMFACTGANEAPKFDSYNDHKIKYALGFGYLKGGAEVEVEAGKRFDIEIEVSDADGHDVELFFPNAPLGLSFDSDKRQGYWDVPAAYFSDHVTLQVLAVDEKEGAAVLFVTHHLNGVELPDKGFSASVWGILDQSSNTAQINYAYDEWCHWSNDAVAVESITPCEECSFSWALNVALTSSDICFALEDPTLLKIGWTPTYAAESGEINNAILMEVDGEWSHVGTGTWAEDQLSFSMRVFSELPDTGWFADDVW